MDNSSPMLIQMALIEINGSQKNTNIINKYIFRNNIKMLL